MPRRSQLSGWRRSSVRVRRIAQVVTPDEGGDRESWQLYAELDDGTRVRRRIVGGVATWLFGVLLAGALPPPTRAGALTQACRSMPTPGHERARLARLSG